MDYECACGCGRIIQYHKTPRERRYYSDACRQRASRARNEGKHDRECIMQAAFEREWNAIEQNVHREYWQDELKWKGQVIDRREKEIAHLEWKIEATEVQRTIYEEEVKLLKFQLAEREAEIVRLTILLDATSKRR